MKTMAQIIGEDDDPGIEAARFVFYSSCAELEQSESQRIKPTAIERRKMEWNMTKRIIAVYLLNRIS